MTGTCTWRTLYAGAEVHHVLVRTQGAPHEERADRSVVTLPRQVVDGTTR